MQKPANGLVIFISIIAGLGGFLFGYDTGIISGALVFVGRTFPLTTFIKELIVSSVVLGALFGALGSGQLADYFGRRMMLLTAATAFIVGTCLASFAWNPETIILGRFVIGLAIGVTSYTVPLFISEMAPAHVRGSMVLINAITITGGQSIAFLVDYLLVPTGSWRLMFVTGLVPAVLLFFGMCFSPRTPRWLVLKGLLSEAEATLSRIRNSVDVRQEIESIKANVSKKTGSITDLFSINLRWPLIIGVGLGVLQQFVGINTVMYYGPTIFKAAGFQGVSAQVLATFMMGIVNTIMSVVAVLLIDRLGRRFLLLGGMLIAGLSLAIVSFIFSMSLDQNYFHWVTLFLMMSYIAGYCLSVGSLFWLVIAEIYPLSSRGLAMSFVTAIQWFANFVVAASFLSILNYFGPAETFLIYCIMCVIAFFFCYFFVPETKGVALEEMELRAHL